MLATAHVQRTRLVYRRAVARTSGNIHEAPALVPGTTFGVRSTGKCLAETQQSYFFNVLAMTMRLPVADRAR